MAPEAVPVGFRRAESGLILPEPLSRAREVWTKSEWQLLERTTKLLASRGVLVYLRCARKACQAAPLQRLRRVDGGITLQCEHLDREFQGHL